jgi:hypothetical protein
VQDDLHLLPGDQVAQPKAPRAVARALPRLGQGSDDQSARRLNLDRDVPRDDLQDLAQLAGQEGGDLLGPSMK